MIVKVKEPQPEEVARLEPRHTLFTYLHLAPDPELTRGWSPAARPASPTRRSRTRAAGCRCSRRCPRSRARSPPRPARSCSRSRSAAAGILLGGVPGVAAAKVMIIGGGVVGHERGVHRDRDGGRRLRLRPQHRPPARARHRLRRARLDVLRVDAGDRGAPARGRPRDRRGARARREGAARDHPRAAQADEAGRGARRRLDRPGRLLRDLAADDPLRPDLRGRGHHPLLRGQHARRGADHLDLRADQRDDALRPRARRRRRRGRRSTPTRAWPGAQRRRRPGHLRAGGRGDRPALHADPDEALAASGPRPERPRRRCYHPAPHADHLPARPQGPQGPEEEARHPGPEVRARAARRRSPPRSGAACARASTRPRRRSRTPRCARSPACG